MRKTLALMILAVLGSAAQAQDPSQQAAQAAQQATQQAQQAAQQAMQQAQQAADQASQAAQQANQQAAQAAQQAAQSSTPYWGGPGLAATPKFSVKPGSYNNTVTVRITDSTRDSTIYYTTDGWTPTPDSQIYRGPITIDKTMTLQAVAISPYTYRSLVATAKYTLSCPPCDAGAAPQVADGTRPPASDGVASAGPMQSPDKSASALPSIDGATGKIFLAQDTPVPLEFGSTVTSKTAQVGDTIKMALAEDMTVDGVVVAKKGTPATGTVVAVNHTGPGGAPGDVTFEAESMTVNGTVVRLYGSATREGQAKTPNAAILIPVVGPFTAFRHGTDAVIDKGTPFTAYVDTAASLAVVTKN